MEDQDWRKGKFLNRDVMSQILDAIGMAFRDKIKIRSSSMALNLPKSADQPFIITITVPQDELLLTEEENHGNHS